jgi:hypothetical protein
MLRNTINHQTDLMSGVGFEPTDLWANRDGRLSKKQLHLIYQRRATYMHLVCAFLVMAIVCALYGMSRLFVFQETNLMTLIIAMMGVSMLCGFYANLQFSKYNSDLYQGEVAVQEGRVTLDLFGSNSSAQFYVRVGDEKFAISKQTFLSFKNRDMYRLYYAPNSKVLLSVEALREE